MVLVHKNVYENDISSCAIIICMESYNKLSNNKVKTSDDLKEFFSNIFFLFLVIFSS